MTSSVLQHLLDIRQRRGAGYLPLLDPDRLDPDELEARAQLCVAAGADAILIGTSLMFSSRNAVCFERVRTQVNVPVISFPGSAGQMVPTADAILFLSLVSGRNPEFLIGEHVKAAPLIREYGIETIPTGYMLVESGTLTSVEFMSDTRPIPRDKTDIAMAHALAAEYLGMRLIYLETGSGACAPVPDEMVSAVADCVSVPVVVGGGIRDPKVARAKVEAGADFVVTGSVVEDDQQRLYALSRAVHLQER